MDRLFIDANVLFSAAYNPEGRLVELWKLDEIELLTSVYAIDEAERNLETDAQREAMHRLLSSMTVVDPPIEELPDGIALVEKDRPIMMAAIASRATHLVTGDKHFRRYFGHRVEGVLIQRPADYLDRRRRRH